MKWKIGDLLQYKNIHSYHEKPPAYGVVIGYRQKKEDGLWYTIHWFDDDKRTKETSDDPHNGIRNLTRAI